MDAEAVDDDGDEEGEGAGEGESYDDLYSRRQLCIFSFLRGV